MDRVLSRFVPVRQPAVRTGRHAIKNEAAGRRFAAGSAAVVWGGLFAVFGSRK